MQWHSHFAAESDLDVLWWSDHSEMFDLSEPMSIDYRRSAPAKLSERARRQDRVRPEEATVALNRRLDVALASCAELPEHDPDEALLTAALDRAGLRCAVLSWDDGTADFASARMTVLRSTWNYPLRADDFGAWLEGVAAVSDLWNPLPVVRWNLHKGYLLELEADGIATAPTALLERGSSSTLAEVKRGRGWGAVVVKPAVSANSFDTIRVDEAGLERGERHLRDLVARRDVLVQPYLPSVAGYGERAVIWIDGKLTHAVGKRPRFGGAAEVVSTSPLAITAAEASLAERAIEFAEQKFESRLLYARVDMAPGEAGGPVVMELELIEPSLYFRQSNEALDRFVVAIRDRLRPGAARIDVNRRDSGL